MRTFLILLNPFAPHISSELAAAQERATLPVKLADA
jgi:hypothetical protein